MAANVGGTACDFVKTVSVDEQTERIETFAYPGRDGVGAHLLGLNGGRFVFAAVKYDTVANVETWLSALFGWQGTVASIEDDRGDTYSLLITTATRTSRRPAWTPDTTDRERAEMRIEAIKVS
jgi:hypothetical protein